MSIAILAQEIQMEQLMDRTLAMAKRHNITETDGIDGRCVGYIRDNRHKAWCRSGEWIRILLYFNRHDIERPGCGSSIVRTLSDIPHFRRDGCFYALRSVLEEIYGKPCDPAWPTDDEPIPRL